MRKRLGLFGALFLTFVLVACGEFEIELESELKSEAESVTLNGLTATMVIESLIDDGNYELEKDELEMFLPDLNHDIPTRNFTIYLKLIDTQLDDEDIDETQHWVPNITSMEVDRSEINIFDAITFYYTGVYTFRIQQSIETSLTDNWRIDPSYFDVTVVVTEDEVEEGLHAIIYQEEEALFVNTFVIDVEEMLTELFNSIEFRIRSEYVLLLNLSTGEVLYDLQANVRTYPASITKIMTTLIALEHGEMEEAITVSADFDQLYLAQASQSGFVDGEVRTFSEILHGVMLTSGGEATESLAKHVAGNYEAFVELMNIKAQQLGMYDTHFVTATGLHDDNHYTTANDIAILLKYALEIPEFRAIFTRESYELETPNAITDTLHSTLFNFAPTTKFAGGEILGGRTGFTTPAGRCLASLATNGEEEFILITFGARGDDANLIAPILDALMIYEYFLQ